MNLRRSAVSVAVLTVLGATTSGCGIGPGGHDTVVGYFSNASPLDPGSSIRAYGVPIGNVKSIKLEDGKAKVTFKVDPKVLPLHRDAKMTIRPVNLLGEHYVELDTGTPTAPYAKSAVVAVDHTSSSVDLQDVINTLDDPASTGLAAILTTLGEGVDKGGANIDAALPKLAPTMKNLNGVAVLMRQQNTVLNDLIEKVSPVAAAVGGNRGKTLDNVVANAENLLTTLTIKQKSLDATLAELPSTLRSARATLGELAATGAATTPELKSLRPVTDDLSAISRELRTFADSADPALQSLRPVLAKADDLLRAAAPSVARLEASGGDLRSASADLVPLGDVVLDQHLSDLMLFVKKWALSTNGRDGLSHYFRGVVHVSPRALQDLLGNGALPGTAGKSGSNPLGNLLGNVTGNGGLLGSLTGDNGVLGGLTGSNGLLGGLLGGKKGAKTSTTDSGNATGLTSGQEQNLLSQLLGGK